MKKLIFTFALAIFLMPGIANAQVFNVSSSTLFWNNGTGQYPCNTVSTETYDSITFNGCLRTNSSNFQWPYNVIRYDLSSSFDVDVTKTYDVNFIAYTDFNKNVQTTARINSSNYCTTVSESNKFTFFSCKNVNLNRTNNSVVISFANNGSLSQRWYAGLTKLDFVSSSESNTDDILNYMAILDENMKNQNQNIIDNQNKNSQEQIENANNNHKETMDTITNSTVDSDGISSLGGTDLPTNGVLSSILNLPLNFFNTLATTLSVGQYACRKILLTIPFVNYEFTFPCLNNLMRQMGVYDWWQSIGWIFGGLTLWYYILYLGKKFDDMTKLKQGKGGFGGV